MENVKILIVLWYADSIKSFCEVCKVPPLGVGGHRPKLGVWRMLDIFSQPCNIGVMQTQPYNIGKGKAKIMGGFACIDYEGL